MQKENEAVTITFKTDDGREVVFADAKIYETYHRPASGQLDTEVKVVFFTNEYEKACDLLQLDMEGAE